MNYDDVRDFLDRAEVLPSKQMGQNFLVDQTICKWMAQQLDVREGDTVVEVGPGTGSITEHVLAVGKAKKVVLIEFDRRLVTALEKKYAGRDDVEIHLADAVQFDVRVLYADGPVKLIGNLPFSAGGAIMKNFLEKPSPVVRAVLMLQKEVVDRMMAVPKTKEYSVLSLRMQSLWDIDADKIVPPEALHPRPRIDSSIAVLTPRRKLLPAYDDKLFTSLLRRAFAQRRKQMGKQMPQEREWAEVAKEVGIAVTARAEELSLETWVELARAYDDHPLRDVAQKGGEMLDVVDENDLPIRSERRDVIHRDDLLHRAVHILVFDKKRSVFLQKRSRFKDKCPGLWDSSAAGHVDTGEDYAVTADRELLEELGISVPLKEVATLKPSENTGWEFIKVYVTRHDGAVRYPCSEVDTGLWMPMDEVDRWMKNRPQDFAPGFIECWWTFRELLED